MELDCDYKPQKPGVGSVVYYLAYGTPGGEFPTGVPRAAMVTATDGWDDGKFCLSLCVLNPAGLFFNQSVPYGQEPGHWRFCCEYAQDD